ncbi:transposable element Tcb2 transposase [Trichonephila clavipes]|nr:transposable element Tcb2 transposase [Trichonephila clavipes]
MLNGRTELHIFDRGSVTGDRYCEEVLLPHVLLFRGAIGPDFIFMDDNARPHRTLAVEELLESEDITRMDWPAYSPDLNPIEHVWDALGRRIAARLHHPEKTQQLKQMLIEEWALLPQETLHQLVLSMRRRCESIIAGLVESFFKNDEGHNVTVNGDRYRAMITNFFIPELNNHDVQELWFQQDGATCHTDRATIDLMKDTFGDRLISRFGPVNWPPRSCDLTPLDYFLWGYVK